MQACPLGKAPWYNPVATGRFPPPGAIPEQPMPTPIRTAAFATAATLFAALLSANGAAATSYFRHASAGADCHAANGALAGKFTYNLNYLTNVGTADAYVICSLPPDDDASLGPNIVTSLSVEVFLPSAESTVSCMAQTGAFFDGANQVYRSQAQSYTSVGPNAGTQLQWSGSALERGAAWRVLTFNCKLPPGARLGLIQRWEDTPPPL
jgi:hypothetical protein